MQQHFTLLIFVLCLMGIYAAPASQGLMVKTITYPPAPYVVMSARSGSRIHLLPMQARGLNFYLGGNPATYCPQPPVTSCPPGNRTVFRGLGALNVLVPGGQNIYAREDGSFGYTQAHSASVPAGAVVGGELTYCKDEGAQFGTLGTRAFGATGFMACPTSKQDYQVFAAIDNARVPAGNKSACLGFDALALDVPNASAGAWQYV